MGLIDGLIIELKHEAAKSRKILERVPLDKADWKPHDKSMAIGRLATHIAELPSWVSMVNNEDELDFSKREYKAYTAKNTEELLKIHDENVEKAIHALEGSTEEHLNKKWVLRDGEKIYFTLPRKAVIRELGYSHLYHHRGQLSVYLRLLDVPVPGMFGPSADEKF